MKYFLFLALLFSFLGCDNKSHSGIVKVHWDRDVCTNCVMVVSDRNNAVQVQNPQTHKVYLFDDIGCMAVWFKDQSIHWKNKAIVWVTDVDTGKWINARTAFYDTNNITPMAYGFSAHETKKAILKNKEIINYEELIIRSNHKK